MAFGHNRAVSKVVASHYMEEVGSGVGFARSAPVAAVLVAFLAMVVALEAVLALVFLAFVARLARADFVAFLGPGFDWGLRDLALEGLGCKRSAVEVEWG